MTMTICALSANLPSSLLWLLIGFLAGFLVGGAKGKTNRNPRQRNRTKVEGKSNGDGVELYVGNLSYDMTEEQLRKIFEKFGQVKAARVITHHATSRSKGFGFVTMSERPRAMAAVEALNDKDVQGRKLRVNEARGKVRQ